MEQSLDKFEETTKKLAINTLVQNFLSFDQTMNDENIITMAPSQDYKPLGLFQDQNSKKCKYPTLFFGVSQKPSILAKILYQDIAQWELMHKDHRFVRHIPNIFLSPLKFLYNK
jgi:hypothetical protein